MASAQAPQADGKELDARYLDMTRCMERALGRSWEDRYGIELKTNSRGVHELGAQDFDTAPQSIRLINLQCRRELGLSGQPRP